MSRFLPGLTLAVTAALLGGACGTSQSRAPARTAQASATPAAALAEFAQALAAEDADVAWQLLASRTRARVDRSEFAAAAPELARDLGAAAGGRVALDVQVDDAVSVAALAGGPTPGARAAVLRLENDAWRVQLNELDLVYGPSAFEFGVNTGGRRVKIRARAWVDRVEARAIPQKSSLVQWFRIAPREHPPRDRQHVVVFFARVDDRSAAIGWATG